eukprot:g1788.t1
MGNKTSIPQDVVDALAHVYLKRDEFSAASSNGSDELSATDLLTVIRKKSAVLRAYANSLDKMTTQSCRELIGLVDINMDKAIDFNEYCRAMVALQEGMHNRKVNGATAIKAMDVEKRARIKENMYYGEKRQGSKKMARKFQVGLMMKESEIGVSPKERRRYKDVRSENRRRAAAAADREKELRIKEQEKRKRSRHAAAKILSRYRLKHESQRVGLSPKERKNMSLREVRTANQERAIAAMKEEQSERSKTFRPKRHMCHDTSKVLQQHWASSVGLSPKEQKGLTPQQIREEHQRRALRAMDLERMERIRDEMSKEAEQLENRKISQTKARVAANREKVRRTLAWRRVDEDAEELRKKNQERARIDCEHEQARRAHKWNHADVMTSLQRQKNRKDALRAIDEEQARRTHEYYNMDVTSEIRRRKTQAEALAAMEEERSRRVHRDSLGNVHGDLIRDHNRKRVVAEMEDERSRRVHEASVTDVHNSMKREIRRREATRALEAEQKRRIGVMKERSKLTPKQETAMVRKEMERRRAAAGTKKSKQNGLFTRFGGLFS